MSLLLSHRSTDFGAISVEDLGSTILSGQHPAQKHQVIWRPPASITGELPLGFSISLECFIGQDGLRRFAPACNVGHFIDLAFVAGLGILKRMRKLDAEGLQSYRAMWLIFGLVRAMKEHNDRCFHHSRDLYIRPSGRADEGQRNVLPEDIGRDSNDRGRTWTVGQLLKLGRQAAVEAGIANPTAEIAAPYGFWEAAKLNPLDADQEHALTLVRLALFQANQGKPAPSGAVMQMVTERLLHAVHRHLEDTADDFNAWFSGPKSSLLKLLSAKADQRGEPVSRDEVRQALLELGWESYKYLSSCIHATMRYIENSLELRSEERALFEHVFLPQWYYGGLPLMLLAERGDFLKPVILRIWESPDDPNLVPILHRMLFYYGRIVVERREADRRTKAKRAGVRGSGMLGQEVALNNNVAEMPRTLAAAADREIAEKVRERYQLHCDCGWGEYECYVKRQDGDESRLNFSYQCYCGHKLGSVVLTSTELAAFAELDADSC